MTSRPWIDKSVYGIANPEAALADIRRTHTWVTRELEAVREASDIRRKTLTDERMRLAHIAGELHRMVGGA